MGTTLVLGGVSPHSGAGCDDDQGTNVVALSQMVFPLPDDVIPTSLPGEAFSTSWLMTSHDHPLLIKSQHGSDLGTSSGGSLSGHGHPCCRHRRKAVVWLLDKLR